MLEKSLFFSRKTLYRILYTNGFSDSKYFTKESYYQFFGTVPQKFNYKNAILQFLSESKIFQKHSVLMNFLRRSGRSRLVIFVFYRSFFLFAWKRHMEKKSKVIEILATISGASGSQQEITKNSLNTRWPKKLILRFHY